MNRFEFYDNVRKFKENQEENSLAHYGTKGQKWGERHWQNADGTFNEAGKERYFGSSGKKDLSKEKVGSSYSYIDRSVQKAIEDTKRAAEKGVKNLLYQNEDGTLTKKGKKLMDKYDKNPEKYKDKFDKKINPDIIPDKDKKLAHPDDPYDELTVDRLNEIKKIYENQSSNESTSLEGTNPTRKTENAMNDILERAKLGSLSKPKINPKYLNEDGSINDLGKKKLETRSKVADISSSVFKVLKYLNLGSLAIAGPATFALSLTGFGLPIALINTLLVAGTSGGAAAIDSTLSKKLSSRADVYYDKLVEYEKKNK